MTTEEINKLKSISIRGRFAYGLLCLELLKSKLNQNLSELDSLVNKMWIMTNSDKLGWWQNEFIENNPLVMLADHKLMKEGRVSFEQIGFETVKNELEFENRIAFLSQLKNPIPQVIDKLCDIANNNISAGCGEFSELTLTPTLELIRILDESNEATRPNINIVKFSKYTENNGWGNKFDRAQFNKQNMPIYPPRNEPIRKIEILEKRELELEKCIRTNASPEKTGNKAEKLREAQLNLIKARLALIKPYRLQDQTEDKLKLKEKLEKERIEWEKKSIKEIIESYKE